MLEILVDGAPPVIPPGFHPTADGLVALLAGRSAEEALAACCAVGVRVRASRVWRVVAEEVITPEAAPDSR